MKTHSWARAARVVALVAALSVLACTSDEQRAANHLEKGEAYLHEGQRTEAALEFQNVLKFAPRNVDAHNRLAEVELMNGDYAAALVHIHEAYRLDPTDADAALHLASLLRADQPERAATLIEAVIEREPDNPAGYIGRSDQALSQGRSRKAVAAARKAMAVAPDDPNTDWQYGHVLQAMIREGQVKGDVVEETIYSGAIKAFERYISKGGASPWNAQVEQARVMAAWPGRGREAAAQFRIAVENALENGTAQDQKRAAARASGFARSTRDDELLEWSLEHLTEIEPRDYHSWRDLANLYYFQRRDPEEVWQRFIARLRSDPLPHIEYARHLVFAWKLEEALEYLSKQADRGIDPPVLLGAMASTQIAAGRLQDARATIKRLEEEYPDHPRTILERAQLDMRRGQVGRAARSLRSLVEEHPGYNAYLLLARVEEVSNNADAALVAIERAIKSSSFFTYEAERLYARLLASRGDCPGSIRRLLFMRDRMQLPPADTLLLARCRYETGRDVLGVKILKKLIASSSPLPEAVIEFARREGSNPMHANLARRELEALQHRTPKHWEAVLELTRLDVAADRTTRALERLDGLVLADPDTVPAKIRLLRAQVSADAGREAGTLEDAKAAFEGQPRLRGALELLVALHLRKGQIDEAIAASEEARRKGASGAARRLLLGQLYRMKGRDGDALAAFEQALESGSEDPALYYQIGLALRSLDRGDEASHAFERALSISSSFPEADDARRALEGT
jgi:tetratricopeptide (TPR) repeat protein